MRCTTFLSGLAAAASLATAQRPENTTICDYYTMALFNVSNSTTQYNLLTALVNTAVIGNYSTTAKVAVTGILNNGTFNGAPVSLLKYFDGMLASSNRGGDSGVAVNFLDGGGADPLKMSKPANDTMSNQYFLLTHLYEYFGGVLKCSAYGKSGFPAYSGESSMYNVHRFMDLSHNEVGYFIQQVGLAAASFGVTTADVDYVGTTLGNIFNYKCSPPTTVIPAQGPQLQAICVADDCPLAPNATCSSYKAEMMPVAANSSNMFTSKPTDSATTMGAGGAAATGSMTGSPSSSGSAAAQSSNVAAARGAGAVVLGAAGLIAVAAGL